MSEKTSDGRKEPKDGRKKTVTTKVKGDKDIFASVNANLVEMYKSTLNMIVESLKSGKLNPGQGLLGMLVMADLMHGGSCKCPASDRPYLVGNKSKYYYEITNPSFKSTGLWDWVTSLIAGSYTSPKEMILEVYLDANCPRLLPKILSDEAYAQFKLLFAYLAQTEVVISTGTGVQTFVEAGTMVSKEARAWEGQLAGQVGSAGEFLADLTPTQQAALLSLLGVK